MGFSREVNEAKRLVVIKEVPDERRVTDITLSERHPIRLQAIVYVQETPSVR